VRGGPLDYPVRLTTSGRTASTDEDDHIRDMIEQVLFTSPGERVNRPDFGCGVLELVFEPGGEQLAGTARFVIEGALERWLGDLIEIDAVRVGSDEGTLAIEVAYTRRDDGRRREDRVFGPLAGLGER
jgi:phage baseplate assembly protein W